MKGFRWFFAAFVVMRCFMFAQEGEGCCCGDECHCCDQVPETEYYYGPCCTELDCSFACDDPPEFYPEVPKFCRPYWFGLPRGPLWKYGLADPRRNALSVGWRFFDELFDEHLVPVSYGEYVGLVRVVNPCCKGGALQFGVEGNLWAFFEHLEESAPLVNADYYFAFPLTYSCGPWIYRLRFSHISSHIGDEYLLFHPNFVRLNPSAEYLDFFVSYQYNCNTRFYLGIGWVLHSDSTFKIREFYSEYGLDYYLPFYHCYMWRSRLLGRPFFGAHFRTRAQDDYMFDVTLAFGYEWAKKCSYQRKLRLFGEWHTGKSFEGQFSRFNTNYLSINLAYAY